MICSIKSIKNTGIIITSPNADVNGILMINYIKHFIKKNKLKNFLFVKSLGGTAYLSLLKVVNGVIGNSSSGIREGAFIGTPVVNIGSRQNMRERGKNVIDVPYDSDKIYDAILKQQIHGKYNSDHIYGDGNAGENIAKVLTSCSWKIQKRISY